MRKAGAPGALILLNGEIRRPGQVRRIAGSGAAVLCADGGARHAVRLKIRPRAVIGDMDSLPKRRPAWKGTAFLCDFSEDASDFEKALRFAERRRFKTVWIAGAVGGRLDHTLVNLALVEKYSRSMHLALAGGADAEVLGPGTHSLPCRRGQAMTLLPATARARVTAHGLLYPLSGAVLTRSSRGLSNRAASGRVRIRVHSGRLWVVRPR